MLIKMQFFKVNRDGGNGVFRIHPRLPQIEIWPDRESAVATLNKQLRIEEEMLEQIHLKTSQKKRPGNPSLKPVRREGSPTGTT